MEDYWVFLSGILRVILPAVSQGNDHSSIFDIEFSLSYTISLTHIFPYDGPKTKR